MIKIIFSSLCVCVCFSKKKKKKLLSTSKTRRMIHPLLIFMTDPTIDDEEGAPFLNSSKYLKIFLESN